LNTTSAPPKWKMAIVSFIGAYSISSMAHYVLNIYLGQRPLLIELLMTITLVIGLTYFAMPLLSRLLRRWLYPKSIWSLHADEVWTNTMEEIKCYWNEFQSVESDRNSTRI